MSGIHEAPMLEDAQNASLIILTSQEKKSKNDAVEMANRMISLSDKTEGGCIEYTGPITKWGYGRIYFKSRNWHAHRFVYDALVSKVSDGLYVCHRCDNKKCINPDHLFLGTPKDNMQDMFKKGRSRWGKSLPLATQFFITNLAKMGGSNVEIAGIFNINESNVTLIALKHGVRRRGPYKTKGK